MVVEVADADADCAAAVPEIWSLAVVDASGSRGLNVVPDCTVEPGEFVLDRGSEVVIVDPEPVERMVVGATCEVPVVERMAVGATCEVPVLSTESCVVGVGVSVEVSPPEEEVDVAEDVTAFFCANPIGQLVCVIETGARRRTDSILINVK